MAKNDGQPYAEDLPYWKSSRIPPGSWLDKAADQVERIGGEVYVKAEGSDPVRACVAFLLEFALDGERFRVTWPVTQSRSASREAGPAAKRQAATMLFHDVKARCVSAQVLGARAAFFAFMVLPSNRTAVQSALPAVDEALRSFGLPALPAGKE